MKKLVLFLILTVSAFAAEVAPVITVDFTTATAIKVNGAHLLWQVDNAYDIGASGATRPRNVYVAGSIYAGAASVFGSTVSAAAQIITSSGGLKSSNTGADGLLTLTRVSVNDWNFKGGTNLTIDAGGSALFTLGTTGAATFGSAVSGTSTTAAAILGKSMGLTENLFVGGTGNFTGNSINFDPASGTPNFIFKEGGTTKGNIATSSGVMYVGTNQATNIVLQPNNTPQLTLSTTGATFAGTVNVASYGQFGGTGSELSGAGYFRVMSGFTKTDTSPRTIASFSSNDAVGSSYKMTVGMTGHATGAQRIVDLQTSNEGVANDGVLRLQSLGGVVSVGANGGLSGALFQLGGNSITSAGGMVFGTDTYLFRSGTSALTVSGSFFVTGVTVLKNYTVATLPAAASYTYGEAYVSDATQAAGTSIGSAPTGGGSVVRGVYSNGSAWLLR